MVPIPVPAGSGYVDINGELTAAGWQWVARTQKLSHINSGIDPQIIKDANTGQWVANFAESTGLVANGVSNNCVATIPISVAPLLFPS